MWRWGRFRVTQKKTKKRCNGRWKGNKKKKGKQSKGNENARENNLVTKKSANPRIKQMSNKKKGFVFSPGHGKGQSAYKNSTNTNKNNKKYCVPVTSRAMQEVQASSFQLDNIASFAALPHFFFALFSWRPFSLSLSEYFH